jgi:phosphatidylglycerophosphate synthase
MAASRGNPVNKFDWLGFIPNALSLSRVVFGLTFPFVPPGARPWLVAVAAATDALDGYTARALGMASDTGRLLDPIADKIFVILITTTLVIEGAIHPWWAAGIAARDFVVLIGSAVVLLGRRLDAMGRMYPTWLGKCTTAAQFAVLLWAAWRGSAPLSLLAFTTLLSVAAAAHYLIVFRQSIMEARK